jgi:hypothetical protein
MRQVCRRAITLEGRGPEQLAADDDYDSCAYWQRLFGPTKSRISSDVARHVRSRMAARARWRDLGRNHSRSRDPFMTLTVCEKRNGIRVATVVALIVWFSTAGHVAAFSPHDRIVRA